MTFPKAHWTPIHRSGPLEGRNSEIKRRIGIVGTIPNDASTTRLISALLLEQNDDWQLQGATCSLRRCGPEDQIGPPRLSATVT